MGVAEGRGGHGHGLLGPQGLREALRAQLLEPLPPPVRRGVRRGPVEGGAQRLVLLVARVVGELGARVDTFHPGAVGLIDGDLGQPGQRLGGPVPGDLAFEQFGAGFDEVGGDLSGEELRVGQHGLEELDVGGHPADAELGQGTLGPVHGGGVVPAPAGELHQHRVEVRGDLRPGVDRAAVQAHPRAAGRAVGGDLPDVGAEPVGRVLGGDPALQGGPAHGQLVLGDAQVRQGLPGGDAQLRLDEVDVGDLLGHRVLHLDARVHLDEHVLTRPLPGRVHQELHGAGVDVAELLRELHRVPVQGLADPLVEVRRRGDLHDLLVPALQGAVALEQVHHPALVVGEDLHLDVAGPEHGLLQEHGGVAEGGVGLAHRGGQRLGQRLGGLHPAHAAAPATGHGLHEDGEPDALRLRQQLLGVRRGLRGGQGRDPRPLRRLQRRDLVAGQLQDLGPRADEGDALARGGTGQVRVLREEPVAGVDRVRPGLLGHPDDLLDVEIGPHGVALLPDPVRLVGLLPVDRVAVLVREHRHRLGAQLVGGTESTDRDLAAIGHQDLGEH